MALTRHYGDKMICLVLTCWVIISADNILNFFFFFSQEIGSDIPCKLSTNLLEISNCFWGRIRKISVCHLLAIMIMVKGPFHLANV